MNNHKNHYIMEDLLIEVLRYPFTSYMVENNLYDGIWMYKLLDYQTISHYIDHKRVLQSNGKTWYVIGTGNDGYNTSVYLLCDREGYLAILHDDTLKTWKYSIFQVVSRVYESARTFDRASKMKEIMEEFKLF